MHSVFYGLLYRDRGSLRESRRLGGSWGLLLFFYLGSKLSAAQPQGHSMQDGGPGAAVVEPCCVNCLWSVKCSTCGRTQKFSTHMIVSIVRIWIELRLKLTCKILCLYKYEPVWTYKWEVLSVKMLLRGQVDMKGNRKILPCNRWVKFEEKQEHQVWRECQKIHWSVLLFFL